MVGPGDVVAVEEPGYPPAVELLRSHGLTVVGVPVDAHGLVVDAIPSSARLVYVTPSHQYPLGVVLSHERRLQLLRWAARHDATIVEDDYDSQFRYATRPLEPLQRLDPDGRVVYLGTFSKVLSPSLRVGFAVVPRSIIPAVAALRQAVDWCPPWPTQTTLTRLIVDGHLDRHIARATRQYRARREEIVRRLRLSPVPVRLLPSSAGLHVTVLVDGDDDDDRALHEAFIAEDLLVGSLRRCYRSSSAPRRRAPRLRSASRVDASPRRSMRSSGCCSTSTADPRATQLTLLVRSIAGYGPGDPSNFRTVVLSTPSRPRRYEPDGNRTSNAARWASTARKRCSSIDPGDLTSVLAEHARSLDCWPNHDMSLHHHAGPRHESRFPRPPAAVAPGPPLRRRRRGPDTAHRLRHPGRRETPLVVDSRTRHGIPLRSSTVPTAPTTVVEGACPPAYIETCLAPLGAYTLLGPAVADVGESIVDLEDLVGVRGQAARSSGCRPRRRGSDVPG